MRTILGRKHFLAFALVLGFWSMGARAENPIDKGLVITELYVWNRIADFLEIVRGGVAVGPACGAEVAVTQYAQLGAYTSNEQGVTFPHFFPPLWVVPAIEGDRIFVDHAGKYWTYSAGPWRKELSQDREARFPRKPWDVRAQAGLGLVHLYVDFDADQVGDFLAGFLAFDPLRDDKEVGTLVKREPARQLGRGLSNVLTGAWEIPSNVDRVNRDQGGFAACTYGFVQGLWRFGVREVTGVFEVVTFPFGWGPIIQPEFPFQPVRSTEWRVNPLPFTNPY